MLAAAWMIAAGPAFFWMAQLAATEGLRHNALLLVIGGGLLAFRAKRTEPSAIVLIACAWLIAWKPLDANLIAASACILGSALLIGARSAAAIAFCCCALPIDAQLDAFVGLPARMLTAKLVQSALAAFGVPSVTGEAILQLESGLADIELACSGVRSLWVGALVFFGVSAIRRVRENATWVITGAAFACALLIGNFVRVLVVVTLGLVLQKPALADVVHVPLGHLVFAIATGALLLVLKQEGREGNQECRKGHGHWVAAMVFAAFPMTFAARSVEHLSPVVLEGFERLPLTEQETALFQRQGALASKWRFAEGSAVIVVSDTFRAHHAPEVCMAAMGHRITLHGAHDGVVTYGVDEQRTGVYWFQSPTRTETVLLNRALAELSFSREPWALVSVVFDGAPSPALLAQLSTATKIALEASHAKSTL